MYSSLGNNSDLTRELVEQTMLLLRSQSVNGISSTNDESPFPQDPAI